MSDFNTSLLIKLKLSGWMLAGTVLINLLAVVSIAISGIPVVIKICLLAGMSGYQLASALHWRRCYQWRELQRISQLDWWLLDERAQRHACELNPDAYIASFLVILHGYANGTKVVFWIWRYQCTEDVFRRLSVHLHADISESLSARTVGRQ